MRPRSKAHHQRTCYLSDLDQVCSSILRKQEARSRSSGTVGAFARGQGRYTERKRKTKSYQRRQGLGLHSGLRRCTFRLPGPPHLGLRLLPSPHSLPRFRRNRSPLSFLSFRGHLGFLLLNECSISSSALLGPTGNRMDGFGGEYRGYVLLRDCVRRINKFL
jgi:hypothetical protein